MDDLLGEDWQSAPKQAANLPSSSSAFASNYSSLRPSPQPVASASSTPLNLSRPSSTVTGGIARPASTTPKPAGDVFGSLVGLKSGKAAGSTNLSIQERQKQLAAERQRQLEEQGKLWDNLGSGKANGSKQTASAKDEDEADILAAFNKDAKVDNSSHYPPPSTNTPPLLSGRGTPALVKQQQVNVDAFPEDDDTFGLSGLTVKSNGHAKANTVEQKDDILGDLGRPVALSKTQPARPTDDSSDSDTQWDENVAQSRSRRATSPPADGALAELIDMGFPMDSAKVALAQSGGDLQQAVGWLLQQAHEESRQKAREQQELRSGRVASPMRNGSHQTNGRGIGASEWERNGSRDRSRADGRQTPGGNTGEKDATQIAQDLGSKLFKSANSLWKASQKQVAKTMAEFQQERDATQPKWMQSSPSTGSSREVSQRRPERAVQRDQGPSTEITNEAALLDMPRDDQPVRTAKAPRPAEAIHADTSRSHSLVVRDGSQSRVGQAESGVRPFQDKRPASKLTRQEVEEQSAQAYISPARRRQATPQPEAKPVPAAKTEPEVDLFSPEPVKAPVSNGRAALATAQRRATPQITKAQVPPRSIPPASQIALTTSSAHRKRGTEAFKRGDYALAHEAYGAALSPLPPTHPVVVVILSNRSLTALKTGDAKTAVSDADRALGLIGPGLGAGESIDVDGEVKEMREFYGKALMRKAEALEHMEKWQEAGAVWRLAVEAGVGGAISIRGKDRCERATAPKPVPKPASAPVKSKIVPTSRKAATTAPVSTDAVRKLREANAAAEKADDEKFRLADQVEARLTAWKGGKADNLRALLQSLDTVLWASAGWKKVGMSDLVMANKVKIIYMKAIAKVHPDKIAQDASTEQRMISAAVFSTLNEAWDKFKKDNNL